MRTVKFVFVLMIAASFVAESAKARTMTASWYGPGLHGNTMANGKRFSMYDGSVAAHKKLPFGTVLILENTETGVQHQVIVQDRGPFIPHRQLDLSMKAAEILGFKSKGVAKLRVVKTIMPRKK